ncbi:hypothetical protein BT69DRAFT_1108385 [Atractiella rhizophila]|nr:hypothetical protein BT69DRAFT_1108385 [Atractiella rhizophila]
MLDDAIVSKCIDIDHIPLLPTSTREFSVAIRKLVDVATRTFGDEDGQHETTKTVVVSYLLSLLKANFQPVWSDAISGLATLAKVLPTVISTLGINELELAAHSDIKLRVVKSPPWQPKEEATTTRENAVYDFRDVNIASVHRQVIEVTRFLCDRKLNPTLIDDIERQLPESSFDIFSYETQLLKLIEAIHDVAQRSNRRIVEIYFSYVDHPTDDSELDDDTAMGSLSAKARRTRTVSWLRMFSKFSNLKAAFRSPELRVSFFSYLANGNVPIQQAALECCLAWSNPTVERQTEFLRLLLDDKCFRDQLLRLSSSEEVQGFTAEEREQLVEYTTPILYGLATSRSGKFTQAGRGQVLRRNAILSSLRAGPSLEVSTFVECMLKPFRDLIGEEDQSNFTLSDETPKSSFKQQIGFLNFLNQVIKQVWNRVEEGRKLHFVGIVVKILHFAHSQLTVLESQPYQVSSIYLERIRTTRRLGLRCFVDLIRNCSGLTLDQYLRPAFSSFISPRLATFPSDTAQAPSPLLDLAIFWSQTVAGSKLLVQYDLNFLSAIYSCLGVRNAKPAVVLKVFDVIQNQLTLESELSDNVIIPFLPVFLKQLEGLFSSRALNLSGKDPVSRRLFVVLTQAVPLIRSNHDAAGFIPLLLQLLRRPNGAVSEKLKCDALEILTTLLESLTNLNDSTLDQVYNAISSFFCTLRWRAARPRLSRAFSALANARPSLQNVSRLLQDLNAFSQRRVEEPDYELRLTAFQQIKQQKTSFSVIEWQPLLNNGLALLQDNEELSMRTNASDLLQNFTSLAFSTAPSFVGLVQDTLLPSLRKMLRSLEENVRSEALAVYGYVVQEGKNTLPELQELAKLLVEGDKEANVFHNLYHIQIHRRTRAWRRIADVAESGLISSRSVDTLFFPLLDNYLLTDQLKTSTDFQNEMVLILSRFASILDWGPYRRRLQKYQAALKNTKTSTRLTVRSVVALLRGYHFPINDRTDQRIFPFVVSKLLPDLLKFLDQRDGVEEALRIPMGEGIAQIIKHLPDEERDASTYHLLASLSQILKSTSQDTRELTRASLGNVVALLGSEALRIAAKELTGALRRGPQLHILAYTIHHILVKISKVEGFGIDPALEEVLPILENDMFGHPAKDRQNNEFRARTKFREVRSSKSADSFQLLAQAVSPSKLSTLLLPMRSILQRINSSTALRDAEEIFRRISSGLVDNPRLGANDILRLCAGLISQDNEFFRLRSGEETDTKVLSRYRVQTTRKSTEISNAFKQNRMLFTSFGLELFSSAYKKNKFDLYDPSTLSQLDDYMQAVGNCLYSEDVTILGKALKVASSLVQCPLPSTNNTAPVLIRQILVVLRQAGGTSSELAQSCLRTLALTIRDCKSATLSVSQLNELMKIISPDLEEVDRQAALFALLRAIISRKFVSPDVYDLMDKVAEILVTNQAKNVREVCRAIYLQFLLDYPQSRSRLKASLNFLAKNLAYEHESGRLSVLELISAILNKFNSALLHDHISLFFVALTMMIANDASSKCREVASELLKILLAKASAQSKRELAEMLFAWVEQRAQLVLVHAALQVLSVMIEVAPLEESDGLFSKSWDLVRANLAASGQGVEGAEEEVEDESNPLDFDWKIPYYTLQAMNKLLSKSPQRFTTPSHEMFTFWNSVRQHLLFPHAWVRSVASRSFGQLFAAVATQTLAAVELSQDHPLSIFNLVETARKMSLQLRSEHLDEALALQVVKNLVFILKTFEARKTANITPSEEDVDESAGEEEGKHVPPNPSRWLCGRMSRQLRACHDSRPSIYENLKKPWTTQPSAILKWFAALIEVLPAATLDTLLLQLMTPLYRIINQEARVEDEQSVKLQSLALEVQDLLQSKISVESFTRTLTEIQKRSTQKKFDRKAAQALLRFSEPELHDKRRIAKNAARANSRKRKNANFEQGRYALHNGGGKIKKRRTE